MSDVTCRPFGGLHIPVPVQARPRPDIPRAALGLDDAYTFLFSFDFLSVFERKNPLAVVDAFTRAFEPGEGPRLVHRCWLNA